jgi:hypothetical protein
VPRIETLTMQMLAGRQNYSLNGRLISLDASASDADVETAIRASLASNAFAQMPRDAYPARRADRAGSRVVAENEEQARELLAAELRTYGLHGGRPFTLEEISTEASAAIVLNDGDY